MKPINLDKEQDIWGVIWAARRNDDTTEMLQRLDEVKDWVDCEGIFVEFAITDAASHGMVNFIEAFTEAAQRYDFVEKASYSVDLWEVYHSDVREATSRMLKACIPMHHENGIIDVIRFSADDRRFSADDRDRERSDAAVELCIDIMEKKSPLERRFIVESLLKKMFEVQGGESVSPYTYAVTRMLDAFNDSDHYENMVAVVDEPASHFLLAYYSRKEATRLTEALPQASAPIKRGKRL